jgi:hypothetical protein
MQIGLPLPHPALYRASQNSPAFFDFQIFDTVLQVRGISVDEVASFSDQADFSSDDFDKQEVALIFLRWFNLAMIQRPYLSGCVPSSAFVRTLLQGQLDASDIEAAVGWLEPFLYCQNQFTIAKGHTPHEGTHGSPFHKYAQETRCSKKKPVDFEDIDHYLRPLKEYYGNAGWATLGASLFSDSFTKEHRERESRNNGPDIDSPEFAWQAFKYRPFYLRLCRSIVGFTFFVTKKGYMGITEGTVRVGDIVSLISGLSKPVIWEPTYRGDGWELAGTCYVHGMMNGECWNSEGELETFNMI